ncbi:pseudouridine-5'-phosphatase-like isoform X2 [Aethina tumida]|uniref:pseudouridine-5'-phosphatase-like isoform X2 n=1 Tax=Aethina tumida TaxID=116153 RepID=UPI00096AF427|nr:pseudouridine-5'-phosphatase-like isoform X2 [Aethina tumida]
MSRINPATKFRNVTHVIFDMDGVLLDSEGVYRNAIASIARRFGKVYTPQIMGKVVGTVEKETARIAIQEMNLPISIDNFRADFRSYASKYLGNVPLMPGAQKMVNHLKKHNIPIAVATSSGLDSFKIKSSKHEEFFKLFNHIICGGSDVNVKNGKPAPDIFLYCATKFKENPAPENCLVFEDSPNGVKAAISANMHVVMIPDENVPPELIKQADIVVKSLDETDLTLFGLPAIK